ncbi:MAG TPA: EamA family transporter [Phycisphaerales bacterium]|nr:EamA family transporter [Phycisphaerales bacterium]
MPQWSPSPILCAILAGLCWGVGEIFTKSAINSREIGPLGTVLVRAAVTLPLAMIGFFVAYKLMRTEPQPFWHHLSAATWLKLIFGSGLLAGFAGVFFFYFGLSLPGGEISILRPIAFALAPATAVLLGWWFLGEELTIRKVVAVTLILAGILMLAGEGTVRSSKPPRSDEEAGKGRSVTLADRVAADDVPMVE